MTDPAGHYAALGVDAGAAPEAITAAFRRKARVLHPDVAGTGDVAAFVRVKAAYDVLGNAGRRAAYDRAARAAATAPPQMESVPRGPRLSDLPVAAWIGLGGVLCLAAVMSVIAATRFRHPSPPRQTSEARQISPPATAVTPAVTPRVEPAAGPALASGPATHYVLPAGGDAVLWRHRAGTDGYLPAGHIAAFSPVRVLRLVPQHGLMEIALADGSSGFIDASRLAPGDRATARRAYCVYNAGLAPHNGEVLDRHGIGTTRLEISNRAQHPVVVKLRDTDGRAVATVFVAPGEAAAVANLPDVSYRPEFATGELWSRACDAFAAGMRAQRFADFWPVAALSPLVIRPDLSVASASVDIPDEAFDRD